MNRLGKIRLLKCPKLLNRDLTGQEVHCLLAFQPISKVGFEIGKALRRWSEVGFEIGKALRRWSKVGFEIGKALRRWSKVGF